MVRRVSGHSVITFRPLSSISQRADSSVVPWGSLNENPIMAIGSIASVYKWVGKVECPDHVEGEDKLNYVPETMTISSICYNIAQYYDPPPGGTY